MKIEVKTLDEMTTKEFCKIAEERTKVFVVKQDCLYQEIDQLDYTAHHLVLMMFGRKSRDFSHGMDRPL